MMSAQTCSSSIAERSTLTLEDQPSYGIEPEYISNEAEAMGMGSDYQMADSNGKSSKIFKNNDKPQRKRIRKTEKNPKFKVKWTE